MEFIRFIGWIISKLYNLLDFKILGFPISIIHIILGCLAFSALITFLRNVTGVVGNTSSFDKIHAFRDRDYVPKHAHSSNLNGARHLRK